MLQAGSGGPDLALDFGSVMTRVADQRGTVVLEEPTVSAVDADSGELVAFGRAAVGLGARSAGRVRLVRPVRNGKLVDLLLAESVLGGVLRRVGVSRLHRPRVLVCAHIGSTDVQRRATRRALELAGARRVLFVEQPVACAIGADLEIAEPVGAMVLDVGGGTTDVAVIALGGVVTSASVPVGGEDFDEAIRTHLARTHRLVIERAMATRLRREHGCVGPIGEDTYFEVRGRHAETGAPARTVMARSELASVLERMIEPIIGAAQSCIRSAPPDLANDLSTRGLVLAGGGTLLSGFARRVAVATGVPVHTSPEADHLAIYGAARCLSSLRTLGRTVTTVSRR